MNDEDFDDMFGEDSDNQNQLLNHSKDNISSINSSSPVVLSVGSHPDKDADIENDNEHQHDCSNEEDHQSHASSLSNDYDDMFGEESSSSLSSDDDDTVQVIDVNSSSLRVPRKNKHHRSNGNMNSSSNSPPPPVTSKSRANNLNTNGKGAAQSTAHSQSNAQTRKRQRPPTPPCVTTRIRKKRPEEYKSFTMDDYWRSLRSWDFVLELNAHMKRNNHKQQTSLLSSSQASLQPLPDDFDCVEEYVALWAPLQLTETKAQILSDVISARTVSYQKLTQPILATPKRISDSYSEHLTLDILTRSEHIGPDGDKSEKHSNLSRKRTNVGSGGGGGQMEFVQNDLVLITCDSSIVEQAYKGTLRPPDTKSSYSMSSLLSMASPFLEGRLAIVGVVVARCKGLDGLVVNVSKRLWKDASLGARELFLLKLGTNVTAVREFRALCNMKEMPLSKYILSPNNGLLSPSKIVSTSQIKNPLSEFGGSNALGIGFRIYVKSKFNQSQQASISAAAREYGDGGFTLVQGPPGSGKTTTLVALLNALHLRQYQKYYSSIEKITLAAKASNPTETLAAVGAAAEVKPRVLVCAPSNAAVDNVILKVMEDRFLDGNGSRYSPSIIRIGSGQSAAVASVALDQKINNIISQGSNPAQLETTIRDTRKELKRLQVEIQNLQIRVRLIARSTKYPLSRDWEIRVDEGNFEMNKRVMFVNHKTKKVQLTCPPRPASGEELHPTDQMPHYRSCMSSVVKYIERHNDLHSKLLQFIQVQNMSKELKNSNRKHLAAELNQVLETNILDSTHIVMTTLGSSGSKALEGASKFSVIVIDEAAQCSEPSMLPALKLGSSHCVLVGDPQQLPATIFSMSGRETKYDRSLFQRLEEAGHHINMLDIQYRMHPMISAFPRRIFYAGSLDDGPNVCKPDYGGDLNTNIRGNFRHFQPFTILDIDSAEERDGTSLSNKTEAKLALHLFSTLRDTAQVKERMAIITPYQQQVSLLRRIFQEKFGLSYTKFVDVSTVDSFQGKEASIVILSCVRASPAGGGIGFLNDVQRMNVALTRAKHFLFVIARCSSIIINPYWRDLVDYAVNKEAVIKVVPRLGGGQGGGRRPSRLMDSEMFPDLCDLQPVQMDMTERGYGT